MQQRVNLPTIQQRENQNMNDNKQGPGPDAFRSEVVELLTTFQCGIVDLTVVRQAATEVMSADDSEALDYVLGMAAITSANLEKLLGAAVPEGDVVERFLSEARSFAATLRQACGQLLGQEGVRHAI